MATGSPAAAGLAHSVAMSIAAGPRILENRPVPLMPPILYDASNHP